MHEEKILKKIPLPLQHLCTVLCVFLPSFTLAQVSGPADASRVDQRVRDLEALKANMIPSVPFREESQSHPPAGSEQIRFVLREVQLTGAEGLDTSLSKPIYEEYVGKEITLDTVWLIAARMTERYQAAGYFLSRVYVPPQEIGDGVIQLNVVQGHISEIGLDEASRKNSLVVEWTNRLLNRKPLNSAEIESVLLRLNTLAGQNYRAVLELPQDKNPPQGAVRLSIVSEKAAPAARVSIDNYGSRFLGPFEITQQLTMGIIPNQKTTLSLLTATQIGELRYGGITHEIPLNYDWTMDFAASVTSASPGYTLKPQEITSLSKNYGVGFTYQWLRQRDDALSTRVAFEGRDTQSKLLGEFPLTNDFIRAFRLSLNYQGQGMGEGYNVASATVSRGVSQFGASAAGSQNLSRAEAKPDFTKLEISGTRVQSLPQELSAIGRINGQIASGPLFSSEEFGYGGQNFGRAYDSSEITGDHGVAASLELRYNGLPAWHDTAIVPYGFYDIGKVWNEDTGQSKPLSASSAGFGLHATTAFGLSANLGAAFPLTRPIATPLDGHLNGPRYLFQLSQDF